MQIEDAKMSWLEGIEFDSVATTKEIKLVIFV